MRFIILIAFGFLTVAAHAQPALPSAEKVLATAVAQAAKEDKKVLLITHASWCGWCHKMDASLADPSIKNLFDKNFVITHITAYESKGKESLEHPGAVSFLEQYGGKDAGLPYWIIFDGSGKQVADSRMQYAGKEGLSNAGCPANAEEVDYFIQVLKKTTLLKEDDLQKIAIRFRKNEQ